MKNVLNIIFYTFREAMARKIFIIFLIVSTLVLIGFALFFSLFNIDDFIAQTRKVGISPERLIANFVAQIKGMIVGPLFGGCLFLSIFSMAGIISNLLEKGNIDLFLSKPISRAQLITGKYLGGIFVIILNIAYVIIGIWILIGIKFSIWDPEFLSSILTITFAFAVIYSLIILLTILTRSSILPLIFSYLVFFITSPILHNREMFYKLYDSAFVKGILEGLHYILPQTSELGVTSISLATGAGIKEYEVLIVSFFQLVLILSAGITIFNKKDF